MAAAGVLAAALPTPIAQTLPLVRIAVPAHESLDSLALIVAARLGFFEQEGVRVAFVERATPEHALAAARSGRADMLVGPFIGLLGEVEPNPALQAIMLLGRTPKLCMGVSLKALPAYREVADLRGCRIGTAGAGSLSHVLAKRALQKAGVGAAQVQWRHLPSAPAAMRALEAGELHALSHIDPAMTQLEQRGSLSVIADPRTLKGAEEAFGGPMPGACLCAAPAYIQSRAAACQAVVAAAMRGLRWLQSAQPLDLINTVSLEQMMGDRSLYLAAFYRVRDSYSPDGVLSEEGFRTAAEVAAQQHGGREAAGAALMARLYNEDFVLKAKPRSRV